MTVSIVVLVVDRLDCLRRCVESVTARTVSEFEWVFVLNGATPEVRRYVETLKAAGGRPVHVVDMGANLGVTPGRNAGMAAATGDLVLFLDDDAWVSDDGRYIPEEERSLDWLARMVRYFDDPRVGVVGQSGSYVEPSTPGIFWECKTRGADCDVAQGYCYMFRRSLIDEIGYLDSYFGKFWHEESEYALRAKAAGYRVIHAGYVGVTHVGSGSGDDGTYGAKIDYMFKKWRSEFARILVPREARR